jgi:sigma-B regulation protein RsbQ
MRVLERNNVKVLGLQDGQPMMFAHGFGCDQNMWRFVTPAFESDYKVVLFDHVGSGSSDPSAYSHDKYSSLHGYVHDILELCRDLDLTNVIYVGHSVASMMGVLAAIEEPDRFDKLVLIGPSPCYIDQESYEGGFSRTDIEGLLAALDSNYLGWSQQTAPMIMGNPERPELGEELTNSFCRTDPEIAKQFARVTFLSDNRSDLHELDVPALILQCSDDAIAPQVVGEYVHEKISRSELVLMRATGHCPNLSAPEETVEAIKSFLTRSVKGEWLAPVQRE